MNNNVGSSKWMEEMKKRELVHWQTRNGDGYELDFIDDLRVIQFVAFQNGFDISLIEAQKIWEEFSESVCASWMTLSTDLSEVWASIKEYFPEKRETTVEYLQTYLENTEHVIDFNISKRKK